MSGAARTVIAVRVQPRASRTEIVGRHGDELKIRLTAPPADGAANRALVDLLARRLGVPTGAVEIVGGHASRSKRVAVTGADPDRLAALLR